MNINRFNINHIIVKNNKFNIDNVKYNITNKHNKNKTFIVIEYNTNYFSIDGLFLETPETYLFTNCILINNSNNKYIFDIPLLDNDNFNNIFYNIDNKINKSIKNATIDILYENTIKENSIIIDNDEYEYKFIRGKLNTNECNIILDNKIYNGDLEKLDYSNIKIKYIISCHGLYKTDSHYLLSWKILKLEMKTIIPNLTKYKNILFKKIKNKINKNKETNLENVDATNLENVDATNLENVDATNLENVDATNLENVDATNLVLNKKIYKLNNNINILNNSIPNMNNNNNNNFNSNIEINDEDEYIYIPNFELELDNIDD